MNNLTIVEDGFTAEVKILSDLSNQWEEKYKVQFKKIFRKKDYAPDFNIDQIVTLQKYPSNERFNIIEQIGTAV